MPRANSRAHRSLWILITATILFAGTLAQGLAAQASVAADIVVSVSTAGLIASSWLLVRVLRYLTRPVMVPDRGRRPSRLQR